MHVRNVDAAPSAAQISFLQRLTRERAVSDAPVADDLATLNDWLATANRAQASALIERLKALPRRVGPVAGGAVLTDIGMYVAGDDILRVYKARNGSHLLVKRLTGSDAEGWSYTYLGGVRRVESGLAVAPRRMTLDEAQGWGRRTGTCCVCAARLTDGESIDKGIGPVCERGF